jgi:MFS family permease
MTPSPTVQRPRAGWTFAIVSVALFMVTLDNLVVSTALPTIRVDLGASLESLEWTVNAYTLAFAVLLLTGAALGDRFGRRRMFGVGLGLFTASSALAALAPTTGALVAARALQGVGAAVVLPLTLTLLSEAVPVQKRGLAIGAWSGISGLGVALGPVVGGAVVSGISWHWIFWLNVPIGLVLLPLAYRYLTESRGPAAQLDLPGIGLAGAGLLGVVFGIVRGQALGWTSTTIVAPIAAGAALLVAFLVWESRAPAPMLPLRFFRNRTFAATNGVQTTQALSPLQSGLRVLPWTIRPMFVAPVAGILSDRIGARPLMAAGLALQAVAIAWLAAVSTPDVAYSSLVLPFILAGTGMALVFAPAANAVLGAVRPEEAGQASGATNAIRELGGVLGIAVLASVFSANGSYGSPQTYVDGMTAALPIGAAVLAAGALLALFIPRMRPAADRNHASVTDRAEAQALAEAA